MPIRVAIIGVGNCAKSLVEGVLKYPERQHMNGLAFGLIGGYKVSDIEFVLAYDVDVRKVGRWLHEAIYQLPNNAMDIIDQCEGGDLDINYSPAQCVVKMGSVLDGVAGHMHAMDTADDRRFYISKESEEPTLDCVVEELKEAKVDVVLIYLPVGSTQATRFYVEACLKAKVAFVNCIPEFIVSDPYWQEQITRAGIPAIGDDMRSQVGASILSQCLHEMFLQRGATIKFHCQTNQGGNTDFHNMCDQTRLKSKKISKENVIRSQNDLKGIHTERDSVYAGPSDYIPYLGDNKVAHIRIEAEGFGGAPINLDCRLSVQDSPNSAGVVIDAIRYLMVAKDMGIVGPLYGPSAATQKTPPTQMTMADAYAECLKFANYKKS